MQDCFVQGIAYGKTRELQGFEVGWGRLCFACRCSCPGSIAKGSGREIVGLYIAFENYLQFLFKKGVEVRDMHP